MPCAEPRPLADLDPDAAFRMIAMRDGVRLATNIYGIENDDSARPVILVRTPYDMAHEELGLALIARFFTERGYVFVTQDIRGKARSEGAALAFVHDVDDGFDTLEWIVAQRWCNGSIGMWGESYMGFAQWAAAASGHPALKAIAPVNTTADIRAWMYRQGMFELLLAAPWAGLAFSGRRMRLLDPAAIDWNVRPLQNILDGSLERPSASLEQWMDSSWESPFWHSIYRTGSLDHGLLPSVLHYGGWWDAFRHGQIDDWIYSQGNATVPQYLLMTATDHASSRECWAIDPAGNPLNPDQYMVDRRDVFARQLDNMIGFYDFVLKGVGVAPPKVRYEIGNGDLRVDETWPPAETCDRAMYLTGVGRRGGLGHAPQPNEVVVEWVHDPGELVPSVGGFPWLSVAIPPDDLPAADRQDVLMFETGPLDEEIVIAGPVLLYLPVGSSAPSLHIVARLLHIPRFGPARRVVDGAAHVFALDDRGEGRATVRLGHIAYRIEAGSRLAIQISSSDYPRFLPHPGSTENPWKAGSGEMSQQKLRIGGKDGAWLTFKILGN